MKSLVLSLALVLGLFTTTTARASDVVPEPGHYGGGPVTFTLTQSGHIHNLRIHDRLVIQNSGELKGRHFIFRHRGVPFTYHGEWYWHNNPDKVSGTYNIDIDSARYYGSANSWNAHLLRD